MAHFLLRLFVKNADQTSDPKVRAAVGTLSGIVGILCNFFLFLGLCRLGLGGRFLGFSRYWGLVRLFFHQGLSLIHI